MRDSYLVKRILGSVRRTILFAALLAVFLGVGVLGAMFAANRNDTETEISSSKAELSEDSSSVGNPSQKLTVNAQLHLNGQFYLAPSAVPENAPAGTIVFDQTTNLLMVSNGTEFKPVASAENGVQAAGVSSLQGQTGAITLRAGSGITINGTTISSSGLLGVNGVGGDITVTTANGIASLSLPQSIAPSATPNFAGLLLNSPLGVASGGTGVTSFTPNGAVVTNGSGGLTTVTSGVPGQCLLSTAGAPVFGACSASASVVSLNGLSGTLTIANASGVGSTITIDNASTSAKGIAQFNSTNFSVVTGTVNTIQNIATTSSPTFAGLTLTNPLTVANGGTGRSSLTNNAVLVGAGAGAVQQISSGSAGECLVSTAGAPIFTTCPGAGGVASIDGQTGVVNVSNATGSGGNITIDDASTAQKGIAQFNGTNFSVSGGVVNTIQGIATTSSPTFNGLTLTNALTLGNGGTGATTANGARSNLGAAASGANGDITSTTALNTITPSAALTIGATTQSYLIQGTYSSTITGRSGSNVTTIGFVQPTASTTINFPSLAAGTYTVCTSSGNCLGGSGGANTSLSNLASVAINTSLLPGATTIDLGSNANPFRDLYIGSAATNNFRLTGTATGARTITIPDASGTICLDTGNCVGGGGSAPSGADYLTLSLNSSLTSERVLTASTNISFTDGGANGNLSIATVNNPTFSTSVTTPTVTSTGTLSITPAGDLTVGATGQKFTLQGTGASTITATNGANVTTIGFATPTASTTLNFPALAAGTYTVCTSSNNCGAVTSVNTFNGAVVIQGTANQVSVNNNTGTITLSLPQDINTTSSPTFAGLTLSSALTVANGGTGANTAQGAINNISGLTTNGDLLYHNGTNAVRLPRGGNGECLLSNTTTILWSTCPQDGVGDSVFVNGSAATNADFLNSTASGTSAGTTWSLVNGDDITVAISNASDTQAGSVTTGTQTFAGVKTFNDNIVLAAGDSLILTGDTSLPGSPTDGQLFHHTSNNQLYIYTNGKWQADRTDAILVAASDSSDEAKRIADYVADGTGDQTEINLALTDANPAGSGRKLGKVFLFPGTYVANATILVPNNTTLAGAGTGSVIQLADLDATDNLIENSDTSTGTGVVIRDLALQGQSSLQTGAITQHGIYLNGMGDGTGASARQGAVIENVYAKDFESSVIYLDSSDNTRISNSTTQNSGLNNAGIYLATSHNNVINGNNVQGNNFGLILSGANYNNLSGNTVEGGSYGIDLTGASNNTVTGNVIQNNVRGVTFESSSLYNALSGNVVASNSTLGVQVVGNSNFNSVTGNNIRDNGGATTNQGIVINGANSASVVGNVITDSSCTTTCYAIDIQAGSNNNYLADNRYSVTAGTDHATINDIASGTTYASQLTPAQILHSGSTYIRANSSSTLSGTADPDGTTTLVGSSSKFLTELQIGDRITVNAETRTVTAIASNTSLTVDVAFSNTAAAAVTRLPASLRVASSSNATQLLVKDNGDVFVSSGLLKVGNGSNTVATAGGDVYVQDALEVDGEAVLTTISGAGLTDCDNAGTSKLLWDSTGRVFSCGTDNGDDVFVNGSAADDANLLDTIASGTTAGVDFQLVTEANITATISTASDTLAGVVTTGTQTFAGAKTFNGEVILTTISGAGLTDCDTANTSKLLWDATAKTFICGTDYDTDTGDEITVNGSTSTNWNFLNTTASAAVAGVSLSVDTSTNPDNITLAVSDASATVAGIVTANAQTFGGAKTFNGELILTTLSGGGLTDCDTANTSKLLWDATAKTFSCGTDYDTDTDTGDDIAVNGSAASDADLLNTTATGTSAGTTWSLANGDDITVAISNASDTVAGVVTTGAQTFAGVKTFNDSIRINTSTPGTASKLGINTLNTVDNTAAVTIATGADANKGLVVQSHSATQSANLFEVQTSAGVVLFSVTPTGTYSSGGYIFGTTGSSRRVMTAGTGGVGQYDAVILADDGGTAKIMTTTTARDTRVYGVATAAIANNATGTVVFKGPATVNATSGAVAIGDQLVLSSTAGYVVVDNDATTGILGIAMTAKAGGAAGTVTVNVGTVRGQTNPNFGAGNLTTTGTISSGLINGQTINTTANFTGTLTVQGANVTIGTNSQAGSLILNDGSNNTGTLQLQSTSGNYTFTIPTVTGNDTFCLQTLGNCGVASNDSVFINGTGVTDIDFLNTTASGTATGVTFTLNAATNPDSVSVTIGNASATEAGAVTTGTQTLAGNKTLTGQTTFQNASNSTTALQVKNTSGTSLLNVDTSTTVNLLSNPGFEVDTASWAARGASTITRITNDKFQGVGSLKIDTPATAGTGVQVNYNLSPNTQYTFSFYVKAETSPLTTIGVGRQDENGTDVDCFTNSHLTTAWYRVICSFTTGATISSSNLYIEQNDATARTIYIDSVQLETGSRSTPYNGGGIIRFDGGLIQGATSFRDNLSVGSLSGVNDRNLILGQGNQAPTLLNIVEEQTDVNQYLRGSNVSLRVNPAANGVAGTLGVVSRIDTVAGNNFTMDSLFGMKSDIYNNQNGTISNIKGIASIVTNNAGAGNVNNLYGAQTSSTNNSTSTVNVLLGTDSTATTSAGTVDYFGGFRGLADIQGNATVTTQFYGFKGEARISNGATVTPTVPIEAVRGEVANYSTLTAPILRAFSSVPIMSNAGGGVTTLQGFYASNATNTGTIANNYGVYIENQTAGTNDYGVYIQGAETYALFVDAGDTRLDGTLTVGGVTSLAAGTASDPGLTFNTTYDVGFTTGNSGGNAGDALRAVANNAGANLQVQNTHATGFSGVEYLNNSGNVAVFTGLNNGNGQEFRFNNIASGGYINFMIGGNTKLQVQNGGDIDVADNLKVGGTQRITQGGGLTNITGYSQSSGNFSQSGTGTFGTGSGAVSLNGDTTVASGKTLTVTGTTSINATGSATTTIGSSAAGNISLQSSGTIALTGTTNITGRLRVTGSTTISGSSSSIITGTADPDGTTTLTGSGTLFSSELQPGDRITVNSETRIVYSIASNTSLTVTIAFTDTAAGAAITRLPASFIVKDSSGVSQLIIQDNGNIGIGSTVGSSTYKVRIDAAASQLAIKTSSATDEASTSYFNDTDASFRVGINGSNTNPLVAIPNAGFLWHFGNFDIRIGTNNIERIRIKNNGNIGIGTDDPTTNRLVVNNQATTDSILDLQDNGVSVFNVADGGAITMTGNFSQTGTTNFSTGSGNIGLNGDVTIASGKLLTVNGIVSFKKGTDYATTGNSDAASFNASLIRLTGASAQTIRGIAGGTDGRILTLVNAAGQSATLSNNFGAPVAASDKIITGTGADITLAAGASLQLVYDSSSSVWRVVGGTGSGGSGVTTVGAFSGSSQVNGASISGSTITFGPADGTNPGMVTTGSQTIAGDKTLTGATTLTPTANSAVALTVNGTSGTAATALSVVQAGAASGLSVTSSNTGSGAVINLTNSSGTQSSGLTISRDASGGTTTNAISITGNYATNLISTPTFWVTNGGSILTASGLDRHATGTLNIATTNANVLNIGHGSSAVAITGSSSSTFVLNGVTVSAAEFNLLDGHNTTLIDIDDAVNTAITGVGTLGSLTVSGATTLNGAVTLGDATADDITFNGYVASNILPKTNDTYDLGSDALRWKDLYLGGETLHIGTSTSDEGAISYNTTTNVLSLQSTGSISLLSDTNLTGIANINTSGTAATSIGNATGTLTLTGSNSSTIVLNGITISAAELNLLDTHDVALIDTNDAVNTAITGVGTLGALTVTGTTNINTSGSAVTTIGHTSGGALNLAAGANSTLNVGTNNLTITSSNLKTDPTNNRTEIVGDIVSKGTAWTTVSAPNTNQWRSVAYGNGRFVAVSSTGSGNRVMTSPDGVTWTAGTTPANNDWMSVTYGNGLFVAVAATGSGNRVMTSPDGINWTARASATENNWYSVTYGNGKFVAVAAYSGGGSDRVMYSADGINWTSGTAISNSNWQSVTYGNGLFVAVASSGSAGNLIMTSPDGATWTARTEANTNAWQSVTYGNGLFVAVASNGNNTSVMTSPNGTTWTTRTASTSNNWYTVTYGNGLYVAHGITSNATSAMTSSDGITWTDRTTTTNGGWYGSTYGNGKFVAVSYWGFVLNSGKAEANIQSNNNTYQGGQTVYGNALFQSDANSATAFQVKNASGSAVVVVDTATSGNIFTLNSTYLQKTDSATAFRLQNNAGTQNNLLFDASAGQNELQIFEPGSATAYLRLYHESGKAILASSTGTTQLGSGTGGNIELVLSNIADTLQASKGTSGTPIVLGANYTGTTDFSFIRSMTATTYNTSGNVLKVEDLTTSTSGINSSNVLYINQANAGSGTLILAQTGGSVDRFRVSTAGALTLSGGVTIGSGQSYTGSGAVTLSSAASSALTLTGNAASTWSTTSGNLTLMAGGANTVILKPGSSSVAGVQIQKADGTAMLTSNNTNDRLEIGVSNTTATLLVLDTKTDSGDPTGTAGAMYYNSNAGKFRCYEGTSWRDCLAGVSVTKIKTADETLASNVTLQDDDHLSFPIAANETWTGKMVLWNTWNRSPDFKFAITTPSGATCKIGYQYVEDAIGDSTTTCGGAITAIIVADSAIDDAMEIVFTIENAATAGTVQLQWAQGTSSATAITITRGSYLQAHKITQ